MPHTNVQVISDETAEWAREALDNDVWKLLMSPASQETPRGVRARFNQLSSAANDLGTTFDECADRMAYCLLGHERDRLANLVNSPAACD